MTLPSVGDLLQPVCACVSILRGPRGAGIGSFFFHLFDVRCWLELRFLGGAGRERGSHWASGMLC
eukprot:617170-Pelagomonas_calceolata.AAC.1